jgi:membrane protein YqaA with SNARE-associated domain
MNTFVIVALIAAVASIIGSFLTYLNGRKLQEIHIQFNNRMDQFLALKDSKTAVEVKAAHAQGMKDESERFKG